MGGRQSNYLSGLQIAASGVQYAAAVAGRQRAGRPSQRVDAVQDARAAAPGRLPGAQLRVAEERLPGGGGGGGGGSGGGGSSDDDATTALQRVWVVLPQQQSRGVADGPSFSGSAGSTLRAAAARYRAALLVRKQGLRRQGAPGCREGPGHHQVCGRGRGHQRLGGGWEAVDGQLAAAPPGVGVLAVARTY